MYNLLLLGMYAVGALIAVWLVSLFSGAAMAWGPWWLTSFQIFYFLCAILMCISTFGAWLMPARTRTPPRAAEKLRG